MEQVMATSEAAVPASKFVRAIEAVERFCFRLSCLSAFVMMLLISVDALARYALNSPIAGVYELTEDYLMVSLVFLSLAYAYRQGAFVRVTSFSRLFPKPLRLVLEWCATLASVVVFALVAFGGWNTTLQAARTGEFSSNLLHYPLAPAYFLVVVGAVLLCVALVRSLVAHRGKAHEEAIHAPSFD